jgi:hypothetical protein
MSDMSLPELSPHASPEFTDEASAKSWLEHVPLANVIEAQRQLLHEVSEFNRLPTKAANRLAVLESLREAVNFVQIEEAKRFTNRALPMLPAEAAVFADTIELWEQLRIGYLRCLEACTAGDAGVRGQGALICQRALVYSGLKMFHHYRAYRQVPARDWHGLHAVYAQAEALEVAEEEVKDYLNRDVHDASPRIAYVRAVMMGLANPNELAQRQLTFVAFLLERWAAKVEVTRTPVEEGDVPPLTVDLAGEACADRGLAGAKDPRYLDVTKLSKSVRNRIGLLRKGESPAKLALGEDCVQPSCEQLLVFLYRQWCQARGQRGTDRKPVSDKAVVCQSMNAIHYYLSGKSFKQPGEQKELTQKQREEIATFGRVSTKDEDDYSVAQGFQVENWEIADESVQGLKIVRRAGKPGKRYSNGQLVAVKPEDAKNFILAQVRWLMTAENGDLFAGVKALPGLPAATAVRATGLNVQGEKWVQALTLTAVVALEAPPTLLVPAGWFKPKRVVEVFVETAMRVRLVELIDRGNDFERVSYELVQ